MHLGENGRWGAKKKTERLAEADGTRILLCSAFPWNSYAGSPYQIVGSTRASEVSLIAWITSRGPCAHKF